MSTKDFKSIEATWITIAGAWNNGTNSDKVAAHYDVALPFVNSAISTVASAGDIGSLSFSVKQSEIDKVHERRRKLLGFCNSIHYESSELIDIPFSKSVSEVLQGVYELDPKDIKVKRKGFLGISYSKSFHSVMCPLITDKSLQQDFDDKVKLLNNDKPTDSLTDAVANVLFWDKEFQKANLCKELARNVFPDDIVENWDTLSEADKTELLLNYADGVNRIQGEEVSIVDEYTIENLNGFGYNQSSSEKVAIDDEFVKALTTQVTNYDLDKAIETITHETRHQYQHEATDDISEYETSDSVVIDWTKPYQVSSVNYQLYWEQPVEADARAFAALARK